MKTRWTLTCEKCKVVMPRGSMAVRFHGRVWHYKCVAEYLKKHNREMDAQNIAKRRRELAPLHRQKIT